MEENRDKNPSNTRNADGSKDAAEEEIQISGTSHLAEKLSMHR